MSRRFDHRDKNTFKKDIFFSTMIEKYWWNKWMDQSKIRDDLKISNARDNGCDNDGKFIESGVTAGADYIADIEYLDVSIQDCPIEIKWVPTAGKATLKQGDIKSYIKESAAILFIYSHESRANLRKPRDYDIDSHISLIESQIESIRWGLMMPEKVSEMYQEYKDQDKIVPIYYMGNKPGLIITAKDFDKWFKQERWL